ncbi:uncharacterized protein VTP21DRAFT_8924 [Calcarisporiella thermophila]|uniref:uncharacterized protein n=1 Tax=Calcarisporiella thermophila TaxID=911321 RepID=UPI0037420F73
MSPARTSVTTTTWYQWGPPPPPIPPPILTPTISPITPRPITIYPDTTGRCTTSTPYVEEIVYETIAVPPPPMPIRADKNSKSEISLCADSFPAMDKVGTYDFSILAKYRNEDCLRPLRSKLTHVR